MISADILSAILPRCRYPEKWSDLLAVQLPNYGIVEPEQIAMFIAQCGHESGEFNIMSENLNYSSDRLLAIFPKYFRGANLSTYHRQPEKIANKVYGNRMGNGPESSGDGFRYRGSGLIQLTGKDNFAKCSQYLFSDESVLLNDPDIVRLDKETALLAALWYWESRNLASVYDVVAATRIINGGTHGIDDRIAKYNKAMSVLME